MRPRGFTLIEVMIALFIAAVMFAIGYGALNQALRDRDGLNASQQPVTEIQRGMRVVAQDFAQIIARPARDTEGAGDLQPAVLAAGSDNTLVTFSRAGWSNPAGVQRPAEQRVRYRFIDGALVRHHWLSLDPRSEEHTSELQSLAYLVCRLLLEKKKKNKRSETIEKKTIILTRKQLTNTLYPSQETLPVSMYRLTSIERPSAPVLTTTTPASSHP